MSWFRLFQPGMSTSSKFHTTFFRAFSSGASDISVASAGMHTESSFQLNSLGSSSLGGFSGYNLLESSKLQKKENQENATKLGILQSLDKSSTLFHMGYKPANSAPSANFKKDQRFYQSKGEEKLLDVVVQKTCSSIGFEKQ